MPPENRDVQDLFQWSMMMVSDKFDTEYDCIRRTPTGYCVSKQVKGQPRLRKTYATALEARDALLDYVQGHRGVLARNVKVKVALPVTWRVLYENAVRRNWRHHRSTTQRDHAERTIRKYLGWDTEVKLFDQVAADTLAEDLEIDGRSLDTVNKYLSSVRVMLRKGHERGLVKGHLPKLDHHPQAGERRINFFDYEEEKRITFILRGTEFEEVADLFIIFIETGMRTSEGRFLQWRDVDLVDGVIRIWGVDPEGAGTKTGKSRRIPITKRAREILEKRKNENVNLHRRVFPNANKSTLRIAWYKVREVTGNDSKDFIWYTTRHTCATRLIRAGVGVHVIQTWLGHSSIETTMRYIQFSAKELLVAAIALDDARLEQ